MSDWGRIARLYELQLWLERAALDVAIEMAAIEPGDRLLDLGTGTGAFLRQVDRRRIPIEGAIGIDSSAEMLAGAARSLPAGRLRKAEASALPFPSASFDVVSAIYLLHLLGEAERAAVLAEARRVIRPQGRLVTVTIAPPRPRSLQRVSSAAVRLARSRSATIWGLLPLDPRPEIERSGFQVRSTRRVLRGYPSLVVAARATA